MTEKINLNNLDKSNWQRYRFDQIAKNISERVDPNNTDLNIYVGLEHIDSESLHITRTGTADDVNGQKLRFYPGDIIFGRRRAYQRKAAIATTDGFCSAHALVLRANPDVIDPKLFPFFLHSNQFMHRAVDISVGSLSPTINWGTLKHQEFLLPPKEQQAELAELLWAMDSLLQYSLHVLDRLNVTQASLRKEHFISVKGQNRVLLGDHAKVRAGYGFPIKYQGYLNKEVMFFKVGDMNKPENLRFLTFSDNTISMEEALTLKAKLHPAGTVVFPKVGAAIATEKKRLLLKDSLIDNNVMGVIVDHPASIPPSYLLEIFEFLSLKRLSNNGAVPSINAETINNIAFNLPTKEVIELFLCKMDSLYSLIDECKLKIEQDQTFLKVITNQVF